MWFAALGMPVHRDACDLASRRTPVVLRSLRLCGHIFQGKQRGRAAFYLCHSQEHQSAVQRHIVQRLFYGDTARAGTLLQCVGTGFDTTALTGPSCRRSVALAYSDSP